MKMNSSAVRVTSLVLLSGIGLYLAVLVPALTVTWGSLPIGLVFLVAAAALLVYTIRASHKSSPHNDKDS